MFVSPFRQMTRLPVGILASPKATFFELILFDVMKLTALPVRMRGAVAFDLSMAALADAAQYDDLNGIPIARLMLSMSGELL